MVQWKVICRPRIEEGLGLLLLKEFNDVGLYMLGWELMKKDKQWTKFMLARFLSTGSPLQYYKNSSVWPGLTTIVSNLKHDMVWLIRFNLK